MGRIIEFLPPAPRDSNSDDDEDDDDEGPKDRRRVRMAWFYRARDAPKYAPGRKGKQANDPKLLLATMHADVNPVSGLRGHCTVKYILDVRALFASFSC